MKYLLDTNVVSESWKKNPDPKVKAWMIANEDESYVASPVIAEIAYGVFKVDAASEKGAALRLKLGAFMDDWGDNIASWDGPVAIDWAKQQHGPTIKKQPKPLWDTIICSMARVQGLTVVTRNVDDFPDVGTFNPWKGSENLPSQPNAGQAVQGDETV